MERLTPKFITLMKTYDRKQFQKDVISGLLVAIIALPLSIALSIASGVTPEKGLYAAIIGGFIISLLGGSRIQISGPTAALSTIVAKIVATKGFEHLMVAMIMAGVLLIFMGLFRLGNLIKFIPFTITTGFTAGIACMIFVGQIKDFLGLSILEGTPYITIKDKLTAVVESIHTINIPSIIISIISLGILIYFPKLNKKIPASLVAVIVGIISVHFSNKVFVNHKIFTIGDLYTITSTFPKPEIPGFSVELIKNAFPDSITIALLIAIVSLLSCVVSDSMANSKHRSNMELIAQGIGNMVVALFGGIPATGAIARTAANVKNGGKTPVSGMVHSIALLFVLLILMPYAALIPMPTIAAILMLAAYNMSEWRQFAYLIKTASKSDVFVLISTFVIAITVNLLAAIEVGILLTSILFMKRMSDVTEIEAWKDLEEENDPDRIDLKKVPSHTKVYEISGPLFFAAADKILEIPLDSKDKCLILRMRSVNAMDATALRTLDRLLQECKKRKITMILSHVNMQPLTIMRRAGFDERVGSAYFCNHIDEALELAESLQ